MTEDRHAARTAAWFAAQLQVAGHRADQTGDAHPLEELRDLAARTLGNTDALVFLVECHIEEIRSRSRDVTESADAWGDLRQRAEAHLPADHPTRMSIRSFDARYTPRQDRPRDADRRMSACGEEYRAHLERLGADDHRTRIARVNVAVAMRDRAGTGDLAASSQILREEVQQRSTAYGDRHPFAWEARAHLAWTLLRIAQSTDNPLDQPEAVEALAIADSFLVPHRERFGRYHAATLRVHLLRAHALLVSGRPEEATAEIRYVQAAARRSGDRSIVAGTWPDPSPASSSAAAVKSTAVKSDAVKNTAVKSDAVKSTAKGTPAQVRKRRAAARQLSTSAA